MCDILHKIPTEGQASGRTAVEKEKMVWRMKREDWGRVEFQELVERN